MLRDTSNHPIHPGNLHRRVFLSTARQGKGMRSEPKDSHTHIARTRAPRSTLQSLLALLLLCLLTACSAPRIDTAGAETSGTGTSGPQTTGTNPQNDTLTVLCVDFPEYDWLRNLVGTAAAANTADTQADKPQANSTQTAPTQDKPAKKVVVQLLNTSGADMHSYQPTFADMVKIAKCDLLIYTGVASLFWIADALDSYPNPHWQVLSLMQLFETQPDRFPAYTQDDDHDHAGHMHNHSAHDDHDAHDHDAHEHEDETDEHLWLSLKMTREFCLAAASQLSTLNPAAAAAYQTNASAYIQKLDALDRKFTELTQQAACKTLLFADRFPFKYFCDDYGLAHEAAFPGCSAETEASFETIISLADALKALPKSRLVTLDGGSAALAETIIRAAKLPETQVVTLYSMQSLPQATRALKQAGKIQNEAEVTYLYLMEQNYDALVRLLN